MEKMLRKFAFSLAFPLFIVGCSNPLATHYTNLKLAWKLNQDAQITEKEVIESKVELALIRSGERPLAIIAKAFDEYGLQKWISADKAMLIFEHGRVIRTIGFANDQLEILSSKKDPLSDLSTVEGQSWTRMIDWSVGEYGYDSTSVFNLEFQEINVLNYDFETQHITEIVTHTDPKAVFSSQTSWVNEYWFEVKSGKLLRTIQQNSPASDRFDISFVSNAVSLKKGEDL